jgi:hypothetical protein
MQLQLTLKDGRVLFGMPTTRCRVSEQPGRCLLPLPSQERNVSAHGSGSC